MSAGPLVSIVTPSYDQGAFLAETIESVLAQDYPAIEYVVVDGGSRDGSPEIAGRYEDRLAAYEELPGSTQVEALRHGFRRTHGEILGWLNSDDTLLPGAVSRVVAELEADPDALLVYGDNVFVDEASRRLGPLRAREFAVAEMVRRCENFVPQPGSLFRRRALELAPLQDGYYFFDFEFVLRLAEAGGVKRIDAELAGYRLHPTSKSFGAPLAKAQDYLRLAEEFFTSPPPAVAPHARAGRATAYARAGEYFYAALELGRARRCLLRALAVDARAVSPWALGLLARASLPAPAVSRLRALRAR